ncbi:MAG: class II fumarate hydratase [bacterium]
MNEPTRTETDSLGNVELSADVYYGAQTQRARDNFPVSDLTFDREFIEALGRIKAAAARANQQLDLLDKKKAEAIFEAAREVEAGQLDEQFVVDIFQTGSGTSTNMNANEVIANRALEKLGEEKGDKNCVHPNDHVNLCQSSNDVIPSALHISTAELIFNALLPALEQLRETFVSKAQDFKDVVKTGRTHLQDATPVSMDQEFGGYAVQVDNNIERIKSSLENLVKIPLGGTAVGTGLNCHPSFPEGALEYINERSSLDYKICEDHFEAQSNKTAAVEMSSALADFASGMLKTVNDLRWAVSGPRCGLNELSAPRLQPGSSIMPGKNNPVVMESFCQVAVQVIGNHATVSTAGRQGNFQLNTMMPVMAHNLLQSIHLLANSTDNLAKNCLDDLEANSEKCNRMVERSLAMTTALVPHIGHDRAAEIARRALAENKSVAEVAAEEEALPPEKLEKIMDPKNLTDGGFPE